jgi:hypothetical protein
LYYLKDDLELKFKELEKLKNDASKKHDLQLNALNQNLATLRSDLKLNNEKLVSAEENINMLKSANLGFFVILLLVHF